MLCIHAKKDDITKISIIGGIGKSLKGEGVSLEEIQSKIANIEGDIEVEINSLGGLGREGFLMYEALKNHKGNVSTKMIGMTASAGTYPFLSGITRKISANAKFLIHEAHVKDVSGNAKKLQEIVDELEEYDEIQAEFYLPYCEPKGKTLEDIKALMAEERWISSDEAIDWGFATEKIEEYAIAAEYTPELIKAAGLPDLPESYYKTNSKMNENKTAVDKFLASIGLQTIKAEVTAEALQAELEAVKSEKSLLEQELESLKASAATEKETVIEASKKSILDIEAEKIKILAKLESTEAELAKVKAGTLVVAASADPVPNAEPKVLNEGQKILAEMLKNVPEDMKLIYAKKNASN